LRGAFKTLQPKHDGPLAVSSNMAAGPNRAERPGAFSIAGISGRGAGPN